MSDQELKQKFSEIHQSIFISQLGITILLLLNMFMLVGHK